MVLAMCLTLCACGSLYDREYVVVNDYVPPQQDSAGSGDTISVGNYAALKRTIRNLVSEGRSGGSLVFADDYEGDPSSDLSSACWDVRTQDALCAYCVENISYEISHIVSYDEAEISISYLDLGIDFADITRSQYTVDIGEQVSEAMSQGMHRSVILVNYSSYGAQDVESLCMNTYRSNPLVSPEEPAVSVSVFSGTNLQRLYEIDYNYGVSDDQLSAEREELSALVLPGDADYQDVQEAEEPEAGEAEAPEAAEEPKASEKPEASAEQEAAETEAEPSADGLSTAGPEAGAEEEADADTKPEPGHDPGPGAEKAPVHPQKMYSCLQACRYLSDNCSYNPEGSGSVYSALVQHEADSKGISLAFVALCRNLGVDCRLVSGQYNRADYYWNIVTIDNRSYHVDMSSIISSGMEGIFLRSDSSMWGAYRWDMESYPECYENINFSELD